MRRSGIIVVVFTALLTLVSIPVTAQTSALPQVSTVFAVLTKSVESKSATVGQELTLRTISDVVVDGRVVIPRNSKLLGHVTEVVTRGKNEPQSVLALVVDKAIRPDGSDVPVQAIIAAVAAPQDKSLSADATYGMMHSNEQKMSGSTPGTAASSGSLSASSKTSSTAAIATAELKGRMDETSVLKEDSQGVIGYEDLSLSWHLMAPPPVTVISGKVKNVKLESGTQMLLRMSPPRPPR